MNVKDKTPAAIQITAEQILREANASKPLLKKRAGPKIGDREELLAFQGVKRQGFEESLRKDRTAIGAWIKYAHWEESQGEMERARSVFERGIDVDHRSHTLWIKYAEMEMKHKNVNRARNIFDRAVAILPRVDTFWYKYAYMEEVVDNIPAARAVFERWMDWDPPEEGWMAYINLEKRYKEYDNVREIFKRFIGSHPDTKNWLKWCKFEESIGRNDLARQIYEECINTLGDEYIDQNFYVSFAKFETRLKEIERARAIYKYALEKLPPGRQANLYNVYTQFEKQFGDKDGLEDVVLTKRRKHYEDELADNPSNYDLWFDYARLEEDNGNETKIREVYERAISQVPLVNEKMYWKRYIYLWIFYAIWEESSQKDIERAKQIYSKCIAVIPHKKFSFAKVWLLYAKFLIRQLDLTGARKILGTSLGLAGKEKLYKGYIELEIQLRDFDRVRTLYEKYLEWAPSSCYAWNKYAELEKMLGDADRARGIFEIAISQDGLDMPEVIWKAYIEFEVEEEEWDRARNLYEKLLERTEHVKVWISFAEFELKALDSSKLIDRVKNARKVYLKAYESLKANGLKEERVVLLDSMLSFEENYGDESQVEEVKNRMPKSVKKRRRLMDEYGEPSGWEEYYDYIFPDDEDEKPSLKLLEMAHLWKQKMAAASKNAENE